MRPSRLLRSGRRAMWLALIVTVTCPAAVRAQSRVYVGSLNFESPALLVPVLRVTHADDQHEWTLGLTGWTLGADWRAAATPRWRRHVFARFTPFNAHSSNYIYVDG